MKIHLDFAFSSTTQIRLTAKLPHKPGRPSNKYYDPVVVLQAQIEAVKEVYADCEEIKATALELGLAELKVRKLLITGNIISYDQTDTIKSLQRDGKTLDQIITITGLSRASIYKSSI